MPAASEGKVKTHISLNVANVDRSVEFYQAFFGAPAHKRRPGYANFDLEEPALKLALQEHPALQHLTATDPASPVLAAPLRTAGALNHLGLLVSTAEQVQAARDRLVEARLATFDEEDTVCCYARQDKVWAHDPDGNGWEVYTILDDAVDEEEATGPASDSPCCAGSSNAESAPPCCAP